MATVGNLIDRALRALHGGRRLERNRLADAVTNTTADTTVSFTYPIDALDRGAIVEAALELWYVWDTDPAAVPPTATVERGYQATTPAAHAADDPVTIGPTYTRKAAFDAMLEELRLLPGLGLFRFKAVNVDFAAGQRGYDFDGITDTVLGVHSVTYDDGDGTSEQHHANYRVFRDRDTADYPSGLALQIVSGGEGGTPLRVTYTTPFTEFTAESNDVAAVSFLPVYAHDVLVYGAVRRLLLATESRRTQVDAATQRPGEDVQAGANAFLSRQYDELRRQALGVALAEQRYRYPIRRTG